jgi:hypothetical protein
LVGTPGPVVTELLADELEPEELTAVTIIEYDVFAVKLENDAVFEATPLSEKGVAGVPFREYVYDVAPLPLDHLTKKVVAVMLEKTKLLGSEGGEETENVEGVEPYEFVPVRVYV